MLEIEILLFAPIFKFRFLTEASICYHRQATHADVAELVDALDLGSSFSRSEGSSPFIRISPLNVDLSKDFLEAQAV